MPPKTEIAYAVSTGSITTTTGHYIMKSSGAIMNPTTVQPAGIVTQKTAHYYDWTAYPDLGRFNFFSLVLYSIKLLSVDCILVNCSWLAIQTIHQFQLSRQSNPWDFKYNANDAQSAIGGAQSDMGKIGDYDIN